MSQPIEHHVERDEQAHVDATTTIQLAASRRRRRRKLATIAMRRRP